MKVHMSSSEIEQNAMEIEYSEEILSAGWNPAVDKVCELLLDSPSEASLSSPVAYLAMKCLR